MRKLTLINSFLALYLFYVLSACNSEITPCDCGKNMIQSLNEIDEVLEEKCKTHQLSLSGSKLKAWNKKVLDCSVKK